MSVFGIDTKEFEKFQSEMLQKITALEKEIKAKATDSEDAARAAADRTLAIEQKAISTDGAIQKALKILEQCSSSATETLENITETEGQIEKHSVDLLKLVATSEKAHAEVDSLKETAVENVAEITASYSIIKKALLESEELPAQVVSVGSLLDEAKTVNEGIKTLLTHSMKRKSEIDELHVKTFGADITNSAGEIEHVDGLVDALDNSYKALEDRSQSLGAEISELVAEIMEKHDIQLVEDKSKFEMLIIKSTEAVGAIKDQLTGLLPGAMAEGLSAAYEKKKDDEIVSQLKHEESFRVAIGLMVLVSLIPFVVNIYLLIWKNFEILQVINNMPNMIISILPLYFPVLWLAYSSNKKLNLSKRLIEEYTHKAVLGKTFSGLSNQIESLSDQGSVREDLRTRLLFNLLQVSSENPGKLITDYNKSDHPLMEALENSAKLSGSVDALAKIPGFGAITRTMAARAETILGKETEKVEQGLATMAELDKSSKPA